MTESLLTSTHAEEVQGAWGLLGWEFLWYLLYAKDGGLGGENVGK